MTATFVHIGDCHMSANARSEDRWRALDQIIAENESRHDLAAWLLPGDFNHARMTIEDRNAWVVRLRRMANVAPVLGCYGNHDCPGDLDVFTKLEARWPIIISSRPEVFGVVLATGQTVTIFVLPYPTEAGLVSMGVAPGDVVPTGREMLDKIFMDAAAQLADARSNGELTLMIGHVNVAGSLTSVGQPNISHEIEIDEALLARLGDCYKGLNHIHKGQQIAGAWYPGSICRLDWGETEEKRYLVVNCELAPACAVCGSKASCFGAYELPEDETHYACDRCCGHGNEDGWCNPVSEGGIAGAPRSWFYGVESNLIDVAPMYHVEGLLTRDGFKCWVKKGPDGPVDDRPASWAGCEVRVRYSFLQSERGVLALAQAHILAEFADAKRIELEPIAVPDRSLRAPEVVVAKTLTEKVGAWATVAGLTMPESVLHELPRLEHGDPEQLIAAVQAQMDALVDPPAAVRERSEAVA